jgi:hypothetical protein
MMNLSDAVDTLTSTYSSLDSVAVGLQVDPKEVFDALSKAEVDTAEFVALSVLAKYNPYMPITKLKKTIEENVDTDPEQ